MGRVAVGRREERGEWECEYEYEYGIVGGDPLDEWFVDDLGDWELCKGGAWYLDSFGRRVYPEMIADGVGGRLFATEFREEDEVAGGAAGAEGGAEEEGEMEAQDKSE